MPTFEPMPTFELAEEREFLTNLSARMPGLSAPSEGTSGANMDGILRRYAELCQEFCGHVREWGSAVFSGRARFDPEVERELRECGSELHSQATWASRCGQVAEEDYYTLDGLRTLRAAIDEMDRLLRGWVTPKLAVGPSAKRWRYPDQAATEEERRRVASLLATPADRELSGSGQQGLHQEIRTS